MNLELKPHRGVRARRLSGIRFTALHLVRCVLWIPWRNCVHGRLGGTRRAFAVLVEFSIELPWFSKEAHCEAQSCYWRQYYNSWYLFLLSKMALKLIYNCQLTKSGRESRHCSPSEWHVCVCVHVSKYLHSTQHAEILCSKLLSLLLRKLFHFGKKVYKQNRKTCNIK